MLVDAVPDVDARASRFEQIVINFRRRQIAAAYKPRFDGKVLLRFPRLFIVAMR